jgi:hypothetical protein
MITVAKLKRAKEWLDCQAVDDETSQTVATALASAAHLLPLLGNLDARVRAVAVPGFAETLQGSYQLGCVDILRVIRNSLGLPRKSDEPKLYIEDDD